MEVYCVLAWDETVEHAIESRLEGSDWAAALREGVDGAGRAAEALAIMADEVESGRVVVVSSLNAGLICRICDDLSAKALLEAGWVFGTTESGAPGTEVWVNKLNWVPSAPKAETKAATAGEGGDNVVSLWRK